MTSTCALFRAEIERALSGVPGRLAELASHEHARVCGACRAELARERALDDLLARVPPPRIPPALARRVLAGLAPERGVPVGPAAGAEDAELEELLDRLPAPQVPADLGARVLRGLEPSRPVRGTSRAGASRRSWLLAAAAVLLAALSLWAWSALRPEAERPELVQSGAAEPQADEEELLAYAVEHWELLHDEDLDVWLASLDPLDELLIEFADIEFAEDETWLDDGSRENAREGD